MYLRFGINLSHTTCAKAAEDEGAPPKKRGKATFVPPDVESKLVDFCIALRSLNFPIFKEELIGYCHTLIQGTKLVSLFKHGEVRDSWYYNWLRRYHERLVLGHVSKGHCQKKSATKLTGGAKLRAGRKKFLPKNQGNFW